MHHAPPPDVAHSPLDRLLDAYDAVISACREGHSAQAFRTIAVLRAAHPCDSPSASAFDGLYAWCERAIESGDLLGAAGLLTRLRRAWETADRITSAPVVSDVRSESALSEWDAPAAAAPRPSAS